MKRGEREGFGWKISQVQSTRHKDRKLPGNGFKKNKKKHGEETQEAGSTPGFQRREKHYSSMEILKWNSSESVPTIHGTQRGGQAMKVEKFSRRVGGCGGVGGD